MTAARAFAVLQDGQKIGPRDALGRGNLGGRLDVWPFDG